MRGGLAAGAAGVALSCVVGNAWGADVCAKAPELTALQVAAVQQQLMVAAFACNDASLYNRFVLAYRDELQRSDQSLQAFFTRMDETTGAAEYHTFKTKMANIYSLRSNANKNGFCQSAKASFDAALSGEKRSLASFVLTQPIAINEPYTNCGTTIAGVSTRTTAKPNVVAANEAAAEVAAAKSSPAKNEPPVTVAVAAPERPPIEKIMPLRTQDAPQPAKEEPLPMIAQAPAAPEPAQEYVPPPQTQPDNRGLRNAPPPQAPMPPAMRDNSYGGRTILPPPPPRPPQRYAGQRPVPPNYRRYYAGGPYARSPYGDPYYDRYTPPPPYYRSPYGPSAPYRVNPYYQERNDRALERAPYGGDDRNSYDNQDDRSNYRAPNDPRFYPRDRYGDYPPQRY